jgi:hypothetical protein
MRVSAYPFVLRRVQGADGRPFLQRVEVLPPARTPVVAL